MTSNGNSDIRLGMIEVRPFRPFKTSEEYLYAMKEDLAEWLKGLYDLGITADNFCEILETGILLCRHANNVRRMALDYLGGDQTRLPYPVPAKEVTYMKQVNPGTFHARDNVSNFISWCRALHIIDCLLFETDDLVMRKNEKSFILCLLEVARRGSKVGMPAPLLVQMEEEIDREIARDNAKRMRDSGVETDPLDLEVDLEPPRQIITNDLKSLDEMVRDLVNRCTCPVQFPMIRISEGKYRIGDTKILIFVRILRSHVMVRVGGGWDTLAHYLDKHDPCRCRQGHRATLSSRLTVKYPTTPTTGTNNNSNTHMEVTYMRSPVIGNGTLANDQFNPLSQTALSDRTRSISPVNYHHLQGSPPPRLRRGSTSSAASSSSHDLSIPKSSAESSIVNITQSSDDSNYASHPSELQITVTPPALLNGGHAPHDSTDFANGVEHASTPTDDAPIAKLGAKAGTVEEPTPRKSHIPTCADVTLRKKTPPSGKSNHANPIENHRSIPTSIATLPRRISSSPSFEPRQFPRSRSSTTDDFADLSQNNLIRAQHVRRSYRIPRSSSTSWTPTGANNALNGHNDKNRTWSGFRPKTRSRPAISPDIFEVNGKNYANSDVANNNVANHHHNGLSNGSSNNYLAKPQPRPVLNSPVKACPTLLRQLLCDINLDTNEKVLEKMEKMLAHSKMSANDVIVNGGGGNGDNEEDYTRRWLTDVDKFSKDSSASTSQGMASPDYGSDIGCEGSGNEQHLQQKNRKSLSIISPRKNNHPDTETKIPKPVYFV